MTGNFRPVTLFFTPAEHRRNYLRKHTYTILRDVVVVVVLLLRCLTAGGKECFEMNYICSSIEYYYYHYYYYVFFSHYYIEREPRRPGRAICSTLKMSGSSIKTRQTHARNRLFTIGRLQHCVPCTCLLEAATGFSFVRHPVAVLSVVFVLL